MRVMLRKEGRLGFVAILLFVILVAAATAQAERLPIRTYTRASGLAHDYIGCIEQDSRGFLWFCTAQGLSRFDGYRFTTYGPEHGLSSVGLNDLLETRSGTYWIASNSEGVYRFNLQTSSSTALTREIKTGAQPEGASASATPLFKAYPVGDEPATNRVNILHEDRAGRLWAGTDAGLFVMNDSNGTGEFLQVEIGIPEHPDRLVQVWAFVEDPDGSLWIATKFGLIRRLSDGRMIHYQINPVRGRDVVRALIQDRDGRLWIGHESFGVIALKPLPASSTVTRDSPPWRNLVRMGAGRDAEARLPAALGEALQFTTANGLGSNALRTLLEASDGHIWAGTLNGLSEFDGRRFRSYTTAQGLSSNVIIALKEDRDDSLWIGTLTGGAMRVARSGFVTYLREDGLGNEYIRLVFEDRSGKLCALSNEGYLNWLDGERFKAIRPNMPSPNSETPLSGDVLQDREGEWWIGTVQGLFRFPKVKGIEQLRTARPKASYTTRDGLADNDVRRLYEDSRGDIWINAFAPGREVLTRWERATGKFHRYSDANGLPPFRSAWSFCEDASGNLWIGFRDGPLARYAAGHFTVFTTDDGLPAGEIKGLYRDRAGQLWMVSLLGGLSRIEDPASDHPRFVAYTMAQGFLSNYATCVTDDDSGHIYVGTSHGMERLDPATNSVKHYTADDGLVSMPQVAYRDSHNILWLGTLRGLYKFTPRAERPVPQPAVLIGGLRVAGVQQPLFELGEPEVSGLELKPDQNHIQIDFFSLSFSQAEGTRYQFKIEGIDRDWSAPTDQRSVNLSLAPGSYRFLVRAIGADGVMSESPASVAFNILRPIWQRWWFISIVAVLGGFAAYALYQYRLARMIELERVRTRIATDLHDDIGSSLSQVSVLSEVIRRRIGQEANVAEPLSMIARLSRDVVDSMNDIVWAINPARDHLSDLIHRMRRFASDVFTARDLQFTFRAPDERHDMKMGADMRREVFLILKESVNNSVRHSGCSRADVEFRVENGWLELKVSDNGSGFDHDQIGDGNGLISMRQRAEKIGGSLEIISNNGEGTTIKLRAPLGGRSRSWNGLKRPL